MVAETEEASESAALASYRRATLRAFLKVRRSRLEPEDVGLPRRARRRSVGLNREEVALLAGISPHWYERFETQRDARPGAATLAALDAALRLSPAERAYVRLLATGIEPPQRLAHPDELWALASESTAFAVFDAGYQRVRSNRLFDVLFGYEPSGSRLEHNAVHRMFADASRRAMWADDWNVAAARMVGKVRWLCALTGHEPPIVDDLAGDAEFRRFWDGFEVDIPDTVREVTVQHPRVGRIALRVYAPRMQTGYLCGFYAPIDEPSAAAVRALS
jgi:transcriptional regulator with XRE-family HTH domain